MTQIQKIPPDGKEKIKSSPSHNTKKFLFYLGLGLIALIVVLTLGPVISHPIEKLISLVENRYQEWFEQQDTANPLILITLAFLGGLIASVSPCILALLPVNLSYIGTLKIKSRWDAFKKSWFICTRLGSNFKFIRFSFLLCRGGNGGISRLY